MFSLKKYAAKRVLRKNVKEIKSVIRRTYRDVSRDLSKKVSGVKMPKLTISR